jgi:hypothetical protein
MHTHTERAVVRAANKKGRTKTNPARCGFFLSVPFIERLSGVSSRRQKQTEILFANPGKKKKFPSRDKENGCKKKSCVTLNLFFLFAR